MTSRVSNCGGDNTGHLSEIIFHSPEASGRKGRELIAGSRGEGRSVPYVPRIVSHVGGALHPFGARLRCFEGGRFVASAEA